MDYVFDVRESREAPRRTIAAEVELRRSRALSYTVYAYDLSEGGCKAEFVERPEVGEIVWVKFEGLEPLRSTVRWTADFTVGLSFDRPMDTRVLEWLVTRLR